MTNSQCFRFLRPYLSGPLPDTSAVYARFFYASCSRSSLSAVGCVSQQRRAIHPDVIAKPNMRYVNRTPKETLAEEALEAPANRSVSVNRRVDKLRQYNVLRYPRLASRTTRMTIPEFLDRFETSDSTPVDLDSARKHPITLEGRVLAVRRSGSKLIFLEILGGYAKVQIVVSFQRLGFLPNIDTFRDAMHPIRRGDIVSFTGFPVLNKSDQLCLSVTELPEIITPCLAPLPVTISNEETMILNRHVEMLVRRRTSEILRLRARLIRSMRDFFHEQHFIEVQTPILADSAGGATARPFVTSATEFPEKQLAMRIAPELWLKRLVVGGNDRVFEIGPSFRNEGLDTTHNPEFTTCEFYMAYANLEGLIEMTVRMIARLLADAETVFDTGPSPRLKMNVEEGPWKQVEFVPALEEVLGFPFPNLSEPDAFEKLSELLSEKHSSELSPDITLNKLLDNLASKFLEAESLERPLFIIHHPARMAPLSKSFTCPKTGQLVSARAELFIEGREIANMYEEENDPFEQRRKFEQQMKNKEENAGNGDDSEGPSEIDESYCQALEHGLPPTGGWGCGVDRLVMFFSGSSRISDTLPFGNLRNVVSLSTAVKAP